MSISDPDNINIGNSHPGDDNDTPAVTRKGERTVFDKSTFRQSTKDAFAAHQADFERACAAEGLKGLDLVHARGEWTRWTAFASNMPISDHEFWRSLEDFQAGYPQAVTAARIAERLWESAEMTLDLLLRQTTMDAKHLLNAPNPHLTIPPHEDTSRMA